MQQLISIINKEVKLEWRNRTAFNGILLYLVSTIFVCYLSFNVRSGQLSIISWNALFWIIILFANINAVAKSFLNEGEGRLMYYFTICSPQVLLAGKLIYNVMLSVTIALVGLFVYAGILGNPIQNHLYYVVTIVLASIGFASVLSLVSGIVSKANNSVGLMAILSFPVIIPVLILSVNLAKGAIDGLDTSFLNDKILTLLAVDAIVIATSFILFPFIWRS